MNFLRGNTASQEILLGPFVDSTDGNTAETALTIANTDIKLFKTGATTLASKNSGGGTHISNGNYYAVLDATDTNTYGMLEVIVQVAGALSVRREYIVLPEIIYDSFVPAATGAPLPIFGILDWGTPQTSASGTLVGRSALSLADDIPNGAVANIYAGTGAGQSRAIDDFTGSSDTYSVSPNWTTTPTTGSSYVVYNAPPASTAAIPPVNATQLAGQTITAAAGVTFPSSVASPTNITAGTITTATNVTTVNGLAANVITAAATAADFTTEIQSGLATASAVSTLQTSVTTIDDFLDTEMAAVLAAVDTEVASIKTKTDFLPSIAPGAAGGLFIAGSNAATTVNITGNVTGNLSGSVGSVTGPVASVTASVTIDTAAVADAVWDEPKAGHVTANTYGAYLDSAVSGVSTGGLSLQDIVDGVWDEQVGAHVIAGSTAATLSEAKSDVDIVRSKTDSLTFTVAGEVNANTKSMNDTEVLGTGASNDLWRGE